MFTTSSMHCILLFILKCTPLLPIWVYRLKTILSGLTITPLRQGYTLENEGCLIPDALGKAASETPYGWSIPLRSCSLPLICLLSLLQISGFKASMNLLPRLFRHALWERTTKYFTQKGAHKYARLVKFPMLFGMEPVKLLTCRALHPNVQKQAGFVVKFNVHHIKYALHSALYF